MSVTPGTIVPAPLVMLYEEGVQAGVGVGLGVGVGVGGTVAVAVGVGEGPGPFDAGDIHHVGVIGRSVRVHVAGEAEVEDEDAEDAEDDAAAADACV